MLSARGMSAAVLDLRSQNQRGYSIFDI